MPDLTRCFVKAGLLYFLAALLLGVILAAQPVLQLSVAITALGPTYFHLFMVGWVTQLIFGIAYWMFPKYSREEPRGKESVSWATFALLNAGLLLRMIAEPIQALWPTAGWGWVLGLSALLQWLAGLGFVYNTWPRIREK